MKCIVNASTSNILKALLGIPTKNFIMGILFCKKNVRNRSGEVYLLVYKWYLSPGKGVFSYWLALFKECFFYGKMKKEESICFCVQNPRISDQSFASK